MPAASPQVLQNPERLAAIERLRLLDRPPEPAMDRLSRLAAQLLNTPGGYISLITEQRLYFAGLSGMPESIRQSRELPLTYSLCQHAVESGLPLVIDDTRRHPLGIDNPSVSEYQCVAFAGIPLRVNDSLPVGVLCVMDIQPRAWTEQNIADLSDLARSVETELKLRTLHDDQEQLQSYMHRLESSTIDFLRSATHRLLSPIHVVQGYLDMDDTPALEEPLRTTILESIDEMRLIIQDLMTVSQVEEITRVRDERINLVDTIRPVLQRVIPQAVVRQQTLEVNVPMEMYVRGSSEQLQEVVMNLVGNAMKYTPESGTISISLREDDGLGVFEVSDNGYGIPIEYQSSLFQPFYRVVTRDTAPIKGTGLGLYLVKAIIQRHGGEVYFKSTGGQGSTFGFRLPVYEVGPS